MVKEGIKMKRYVFGMILLGGLLLIGWLVIDPSRLFADVYYVKVPNAETSIRTEKGYRYELIGYNEEGKKRPLTISTSELLAEGDFLKVFVKEEDQEVTDFERTSLSEVPIQLKEEQIDDASPTTFP